MSAVRVECPAARMPASGIVRLKQHVQLLQSHLIESLAGDNTV